MAIRKWVAPELPPPKSSTPVSRRVSLAGSGARSASEEAFDRLAELFLARCRAQRVHSFEMMELAMDGAVEDLAAGRAVSEAQASRLKAGMSRELAHLAGILVRGPRISAEALRQSAARDNGALARLTEALALSADAVYRVAGEARGVSFRTGDVTCWGTLACAECGRLQRCRGTVTIEQCRNCRGDSFTKAF
jgi:rubrerythrin